MLKNISLLIILSFITLSCGGILTPVPPEVIDIKAVQYAQNGKQKIIDFTVEKIISKRNFDVYLKRGVNINTTLLTNQVDKFARTYGEIVQIFGEHSDVDKNGKILIIFFDINGGVANGSYVGGYFNEGDLLAGEGNAAEIIYIDALNGLQTSASTMVHELQHLINFYKNKIENNKQSDLWANEALSAAAEIVYEDKIPNERLSYFNRDPQKLIRNGDYFYSWLDGGSLADYATVSLFMYWLYTHGNAKTVFYDIANVTSDRGTYKAFECAARKIDAIKLNTWDNILETWFTANVKQSKTGLEGYLENIETKVWLASERNIKLYPSDVVYSDKSITGGTIRTIAASPTMYYSYNNSTEVKTASSNLTPTSVTVQASLNTRLAQSSSGLNTSQSYSESEDTGPYKRDAVISVDTRTGKGLNE